MGWILDRVKEPTTYAGIAALLGLFNLSISNDTLTQIGMGIAALLSIFLKERAS